jgi:hypothetical protein
MQREVRNAYKILVGKSERRKTENYTRPVLTHTH